MRHALPDGRAVMAGLDPGIVVGAPGQTAEQRLDSLFRTDEPATDPWPADARGVITGLHPVTASELMRDLREVTG